MTDIGKVGSTWTPQGAGLPSYEQYLTDEEEKARTVNKELGQKQFLQLLAAQLQYQDPLEPMKDTDFIAQMAQFQSLEAITALSETMQTNQYYSLVGKYIYAEAKMDDGRTVPMEGVVNAVMNIGGKMYASVSGYDFLIECSSITEVYNSDLIGTDSALVNNSHLIGKYVVAISTTQQPKTDEEGLIIRDENGDPVMETVEVDITGKVLRLSIESGVVYAHLDDEAGTKVSIRAIKDIQDTPYPEIPVTPTPPVDPADPEDPGENENPEDSGETA